MHRPIRLIAVCFVMVSIVSAKADTLNVVANGSIGSIAGEGGNGFYMANYADSSTLQSFGSSQSNEYQSPLDLSFTLPTGAVVTGAMLTVSFDALVQDTTAGTYSQNPEPVDQSASFTPGQINVTDSTATSFLALSGYAPSTNASCQLSNPGNSVNLVAAGFGSCLSGTEDYTLEFMSATTLTADLVSSGFNSWEIFNFEGGHTVDLSADLSINYYVPAACTPEPAGWVLLATGLLTLLGVAWRKSSQSL